jgi:hypothetical protein
LTTDVLALSHGFAPRVWTSSRGVLVLEPFFKE